MKTRHKTAKSIALWVYIVIVFFFVGMPVLYSFTGAFRAHNPTVWWENFVPVDFTMENFSTALHRVALGRQLVNSFIVTFCQTTLQTVTSILAAAAIVFGNLRYPKLVFGFIMLTMMLPSESIIVSKYLLIQDMGLFDTLIAVFLPFAAMAFPIFLLRQAFLSFPRELYEAALLDGATILQFVFKMLVPLNKPSIFAVVITSAIAAWNGFFWPLLITESNSSRTVQVGISQLADADAADMGIILAGVVITTIPMILIILTGNRYLTKGLTKGSEK